MVLLLRSDRQYLLFTVLILALVLQQMQWAKNGRLSIQSKSQPDTAHRAPSPQRHCLIITLTKSLHPRQRTNTSTLRFCFWAQTGTIFCSSCSYMHHTSTFMGPKMLQGTSDRPTGLEISNNMNEY